MSALSSLPAPPVFLTHVVPHLSTSSLSMSFLQTDITVLASGPNPSLRPCLEPALNSSISAVQTASTNTNLRYVPLVSSHPLVLQVMDAVDVTKSLAERVKGAVPIEGGVLGATAAGSSSISTTGNGNGPTSGTAGTAAAASTSHQRRGMAKLLLSDGFTSIVALELTPCPLLNQLAIGAKLVISNGQGHTRFINMATSSLLSSGGGGALPPLTVASLVLLLTPTSLTSIRGAVPVLGALYRERTALTAHKLTGRPMLGPPAAAGTTGNDDNAGEITASQEELLMNGGGAGGLSRGHGATFGAAGGDDDDPNMYLFAGARGGGLPPQTSVGVAGAPLQRPARTVLNFGGGNGPTSSAAVPPQQFSSPTAPFVANPEVDANMMGHRTGAASRDYGSIAASAAMTTAPLTNVTQSSAVTVDGVGGQNEIPDGRTRVGGAADDTTSPSPTPQQPQQQMPWQQQQQVLRQTQQQVEQASQLASASSQKIPQYLAPVVQTTVTSGEGGRGGGGTIIEIDDDDDDNDVPRTRSEVTFQEHHHHHHAAPPPVPSTCISFQQPPPPPPLQPQLQLAPVGPSFSSPSSAPYRLVTAYGRLEELVSELAVVVLPSGGAYGHPDGTVGGEAGYTLTASIRIANWESLCEGALGPYLLRKRDTQAAAAGGVDDDANDVEEEDIEEGCIIADLGTPFVLDLLGGLPPLSYQALLEDSSRSDELMEVADRVATRLIDLPPLFFTFVVPSEATASVIAVKQEAGGGNAGKKGRPLPRVLFANDSQPTVGGSGGSGYLS